MIRVLAVAVVAILATAHDPDDGLCLSELAGYVECQVVTTCMQDRDGGWVDLGDFYDQDLGVCTQWAVE